MKLFSWLTVCTLSCHVCAAIIHEVVEERSFTRLRCPRPVEGRVTWSRETRGTRTDVLTDDGDTVIRHIYDPHKYYNSDVDHSLVISKVQLSHSGRYFCNDEAAVDLTVVPSGTIRLHTERSSSITLTCPPDVGGSGDPTWSTDAGDIKQQERFEVFPVDGALMIRDLQPADSGLYYCGGKPAVYLSVTEDHQPDRGNEAETTAAPPETTIKENVTTKTKRKSRKDKNKTREKMTTPALIRLTVGLFYLSIMISILVVTWRKARQIERQQTTERTRDLVLHHSERAGQSDLKSEDNR